MDAAAAKAGAPVFNLDETVTREQAIIMFVRMLGKENEALSGKWQSPFVDVRADSYSRPYIDYAYANGLTSGVTATTFNPYANITATQYLTFVLRALGYNEGFDFKWNSAWTLADNIGVTYGQYNELNNSLTRGGVAEITYKALSAVDMATDKPLYESLLADGVITKDMAAKAGLTSGTVPSATPSPSGVTYYADFPTIPDVGVINDVLTVQTSTKGYDSTYNYYYKNYYYYVDNSSAAIDAEYKFKDTLGKNNIKFNLALTAAMKATDEPMSEGYEDDFGGKTHSWDWYTRVESDGGEIQIAIDRYRDILLDKWVVQVYVSIHYPAGVNIPSPSPSAEPVKAMLDDFPDVPDVGVIFDITSKSSTRLGYDEDTKQTNKLYYYSFDSYAVAERYRKDFIETFNDYGFKYYNSSQNPKADWFKQTIDSVDYYIAVSDAKINDTFHKYIVEVYVESQPAA